MLCILWVSNLTLEMLYYTADNGAEIECFNETGLWVPVFNERAVRLCLCRTCLRSAGTGGTGLCARAAEGRSRTAITCSPWTSSGTCAVWSAASVNSTWSLNSPASAKTEASTAKKTITGEQTRLLKGCSISRHFLRLEWRFRLWINNINVNLSPEHAFCL